MAIEDVLNLGGYDDPEVDPFEKAVRDRTDEIFALLKETAIEQGGIKSKESSASLSAKKKKLYKQMVDDATKALLEFDFSGEYPEYFDENGETVLVEEVVAEVKRNADIVVKEILAKNPNLSGPGLLDTELGAQPSAEPASGATRGKVIYVDDLASVPQGEVAVWGANLQNYRTGTSTPGAGQAEAAVGRDNWIGIPTKRTAGEFLQDQDLKVRQFSELMDKQLKRIEATLASGKDVYFPSSGIGTGRAKLQEKAPAVYDRLNQRLSEIGISNAGMPATETAPQSPASGAISFEENNAENTKAEVTPKNTKMLINLPPNMINLPPNILAIIRDFFQTEEGAKFAQYVQNVKDGIQSDSAMGDNPALRQLASRIALYAYSPAGFLIEGTETNQMLEKRADVKAAELGISSIDDSLQKGTEIARLVMDSLVAGKGSVLDQIAALGAAPQSDPTMPMFEAMEAKATLENPKISAPGGAARVAKILNGFAGTRARVAEKNKKFTNMSTRMSWRTPPGTQDIVLSQIDRAIGTMGVFGMFHDKKEPWGAGDIQKMIADLATTLGVDATDEFDTGSFLANKKLVAEVFRDMLMAIRHLNNNPDLLDQASRDNLSAMVIEMSRILHDYADPRSRAIFQKMNKRVSYADKKSEARFGLTADAAEIAVQGVQMPTNAPEGEQARLQRVAAAQVGQVPQASMGGEPSVTRSLSSELGKNVGADRNVSDLQRYVDEVGLYQGERDDTAHIDIKGMVKFTGTAPAKVDMDRVERGYSIALGEFLDSPLGFLADKALDLNRFFYQTRDGSLKLTKLERRGDFATPIAVRTNKKYRSGVAPSERVSGLTPNAEQSDANAEMQMIVDAADRATQLSSGRLSKLTIPVEGITLKIPEESQQIMRERLAKWEDNRNKLAARMGDKDADAYLATEEGILQFGEKPEVLTEVTIEGDYNPRVFNEDGTTASKTLVMPESVAARLVASNPEIASRVSKLGDSYQIRFDAVVSPQYIVLKNGTVVSPRSAEEGVITHRKVHPVRVRRVGPDITRTERGIKVRNPKNMLIEIEQFSPDRFSPEGGTDFESADQVSYSREEVASALRRFQETFGTYTYYDKDGNIEVRTGPGFNSPESPALFDQIVEIIRTDAYSALEIIAINGDVFPQLEAELISSITELGDFRVDRVPTYFKARKGVIEGVEQSGLGTMKGRVLTAAEARRLPMDPLVRNNLKTGDVRDIMFNPERFGVSTDSPIVSEVEMSQAIVRGLMLLKKMSTIAGVQIGYGGLRAPDLRHETRRGPIELIRRQPFWMLADREVYERAARASASAEAASRAFGGFGEDIERLSTESGRAALQAMLEADEAAMLAARAAVEVARGVLGREWSIELDPQYQRTRFPENPDPTRRAADAQYYRYARLMDTIEGRVVELTPMTGGALAGMRSSGALSAKADKFFADLQRAGIQIQATETSPEGLTKTEIDGSTLTWDPEFGWIFDPVPEVPGRVARGTTRFLLSSLSPKDQDALIVEMVNRIGESFATRVKPSGNLEFTNPNTFGMEEVSPPSLFERTGGLGEFPRFRTIEEVRRVVDPAEIAKLFNPIETIIMTSGPKGNPIVEERRRSGEIRVIERPFSSGAEVRETVMRLGEAIANPTRRTSVPQGYIKIIKGNGTEEVVEVGEFLRRRKKREVGATEYDDLDGIMDEEDMSWSADEQQGETDTYEDAPQERLIGMDKMARQLAVRLAIALQKSGSPSAQDTIESVLSEFRSEFGDVSDVKTLNKLFIKFWRQFTKVTLGKNVYTRTRMLVKAMGKNIWVEKGIALLNQGPEGTPALGITTRPSNEDKSGKITYGPEETIVVTKKGRKLINVQVALPVLRELRPIFMDADLKVARDMYEFFAKFFGVEVKTVKGEVKIPRLDDGPATKIIDVSIRQITRGKIPEFNVDLVQDDSVRRVSMDEQGRVQAGAASATGRPKKTAAETGDVSFDDLGGEAYEPDYDAGTPSDVDPEMNYSVRQGKLLGLLQPDRLLPRMSPQVRSIDASIRTPMGGTVAGAAVDFATLGIGGNLTPENALLTGALNATSLLSKSPLKSTAIGAAASLGVTAATGGDIGRTLFNLIGSVGGGIIGGVASGGLGSLSGSVAGGFAADELWKALFNQNEGWGIRRSAPTPDLNVRLP